MLGRITPVIGVLAAVLTLAAQTSAAAASPPDTYGLALVEGEAQKPPPPEPRMAHRVHELTQLAMQHPTHFSQPWIDTDAGQVVIDVTSDTGKQLAGALPLTGRSARVTQRVRWVRNSQARLDKITDELTRLTEAIAPGHKAIAVIEQDPRRNRLIVTIDRLSPRLLSALAARYGRQVLAIRHQPGFVRPGLATRDADYSPFYGGSQLNYYTSCTGGFAWQWWGPTRLEQGMLTAGHCYPSGATDAGSSVQVMGPVTEFSRENWDNGAGTRFFTGQNVNRGDLALIQLRSGPETWPRVYSGGTNDGSYRLVKEMWSRRALMGDKFCTDGRQTLEECGWTVNGVALTVAYTGGSFARRVHRGYRKGECIIAGDSGGPVYTVRGDNGVAAKGIISGALNATPCNVYFTDIWEAYDGLPGTLQTN